MAFGEDLARMIARARPAGARVGQSVMRSPGSSDIRTTSIGVDLGALTFLLGFKPLPELEKSVDTLSKRLFETPEEQRKALLADPIAKQLLYSLEQRGVPLTKYGIRRKTPPSPPGALTRLGAAFGIGTTPPAEVEYEYVPTYAEQVPKELRPFAIGLGRAITGTEAAATPGVSERIVATERAIKEPTGIERAIKEAELATEKAKEENMRAQTELVRARLQGLIGEQEFNQRKLELDEREAKARIAHTNALTNKIIQETKLLSQGMGIPESTLKLMDSAHKRFSDRMKDLEKNMASWIGTDDGADKYFTKFAGDVFSHVSEINALGLPPDIATSAAEVSVRAWFNAVDAIMTKPKYSWWGGQRAYNEQELQYRLRWLQTAAQMLSRGGVKSPDLYTKFVEWARSLGLTDDQIRAFFRGR